MTLSVGLVHGQLSPVSKPTVKQRPEGGGREESCSPHSTEERRDGARSSETRPGRPLSSVHSSSALLPSSHHPPAGLWGYSCNSGFDSPRHWVRALTIQSRPKSHTSDHRWHRGPGLQSARSVSHPNHGAVPHPSNTRCTLKSRV